MRHAREDYNRIQDPLGLIGEDEPVFLLLGRDETAPETIMDWAFKQKNPDIAIMAGDWSNVMLDWQAKNGCGSADLPKPQPLLDFDFDFELKILLQTTPAYNHLKIENIILPQYIRTHNLCYEIIFSKRKAVSLVSVSPQFLDSIKHDVFNYFPKIMPDVLINNFGLKLLNLQKRGKSFEPEAIKHEEYFVEFQKELEQLINKYSLENGSNTADFLLAEYLVNAIKNLNELCQKKDKLRE